MQKELKNILKGIEGNFLGIGLEEEYSKIIEENEKIIQANLLDTPTKSKGKKGKGKGKTIRIKKIRKYFKKKSVDYLLCNSTVIQPYRDSIIRNSIYMTRGTIYFYGKEEELEEIRLKYNRYPVDIKLQKYQENGILKVDCLKVKWNPFKNIVYVILDFMQAATTFIGDYLMG